MIYIDSSVVLAWLLAEEKAPSESLFEEELVASRLLLYEVWNRIHSDLAAESRSDEAHAILERIDLYDMTSTVLARALEPFPTPIRALDALHLATATYLIGIGSDLALATYDRRMLAAAETLGVPVYEI